MSDDNAVATLASGGHVLAASKSHFVRRGDPRHLRLSVDVGHRYSDPQYPLVSLGSLLSEPIKYGTSTRLEEDGVGLPVLRMNNLTMHGWDTADLKHLDAPADETTQLLLRRGDVLVNRTNGSISLVGKAAMFDLEGDWLFASYLLRLRLDQTRILPEFLVHFLNSPAGRLQIERVARPILMVNVSPPELRSLVIPLPSLEEQEALVRPVRQALDDKVQRESDAVAETLAIDDAFHEAIGVTRLAGPFPLGYAATPTQAQAINRLGAQFFHPERLAAIRAVIDAKHGRPRRLRELADFVIVRDTPEPGRQFLGLAAVESHTGELLPVSDEPSDGRRYEAGDVLFSRLRPYLNKVYRAETSGWCSTEFHVLRVRDTAAFDPTYLALALRSPLVLAQTRHLTTGNTHPRAVEADAGDIVLPVPEIDVQRSLGEIMNDRRVRAQQIRRTAHNDWVRAQLDFNGSLLGH